MNENSPILKLRKAVAYALRDKNIIEAEYNQALKDSPTALALKQQLDELTLQVKTLKQSLAKLKLEKPRKVCTKFVKRN